MNLQIFKYVLDAGSVSVKYIKICKFIRFSFLQCSTAHSRKLDLKLVNPNTVTLHKVAFIKTRVRPRNSKPNQIYQVEL